MREGDDEVVDVHETNWYQAAKADMPPGDVIRIYRDIGLADGAVVNVASVVGLRSDQ